MEGFSFSISLCSGTSLILTPYVGTITDLLNSSRLDGSYFDFLALKSAMSLTTLSSTSDGAPFSDYESNTLTFLTCSR